MLRINEFGVRVKLFGAGGFFKFLFEVYSKCQGRQEAIYFSSLPNQRKSLVLCYNCWTFLILLKRVKRRDYRWTAGSVHRLRLFYIWSVLSCTFFHELIGFSESNSVCFERWLILYDCSDYCINDKNHQIQREEGLTRLATYRAAVLQASKPHSVTFFQTSNRYG